MLVPKPAGRIGVDLEVLLDQLDSGLRIVIDEERPGGVKHTIGLGMRDKEATLGQRTIITWRNRGDICRPRLDPVPETRYR